VVLRQPGSVLTRRAAVLGSPIAHSLSPTLHRAAYRALGLDWSYDAIEVDAPGLPDFLAGLDTSWVGLSLTMPLKEAVLPLLDAMSPLAQATRSVNTLLLGDDTRAGHNTDVTGIVRAVLEAAPTANLESVTIIGAGATARSAAAAARELDARELIVVARRPEAAGDVVATAEALGIQSTRVRGWDAAAEALVTDLVISTVPGDAASSLAPGVPAAPRVLLDVTYHPWPTALARAWAMAGGTAIPGSQMLLWQAVRQVRLMTGREAPAAAMADALASALAC
jgi:shikimate dehydrogenase